MGEPTLATTFLATARAAPDRVALREYGSERELTFARWVAEAGRVAGGLADVGIEPGDRVALLLTTRLEFGVVDLGALLLGAVPFSLYATSTVQQLAAIVANGRPRLLIADAPLAAKARDLVTACDELERLVVLEDHAPRPGELSLRGLQERCPADFDVGAAAARGRADELCTLIYTSGTTGAAKGVEFTHHSMLAQLDSVRRRFRADPDDRAISYLPMAHVAERIYGHYAAIVYGYQVTSLPDLAQLYEAIREIRPTRFFGVPRIYEKLLAGIHRAISELDDPPATRAALAAAVERVRAEQSGGAPAPRDEAADALLAPLREHTGLEHAHFLAVGGAPSSPGMLEELHAIGLAVNEFYGSSEAMIVTTSPPDRVRIGTAGLVLPGMQLRLADDDGEILVKGPTVTPGYHRDPERTAEVLDADGWLHTGDVGVHDEEGYLRVVDRKKALIISAQGKNMSPANIEQAIKGGVALIAQVVAVGDRRPYNVALVVLDPDGLRAFARTHGLDGERPFAELARDERVLAAVDEAVRRGNERLSRPEQIRRHTVLDREWAPAGDELTPTAKLRRREIGEKHAEAIDALYADRPA